MTTIQLLIGALTLLTNAFFGGAEFALISVRRSQIEPQAQAGSKRARTTLWGVEHLSAVMATAQLGITVSSLVLGAVAEPAIAHLLEPPFHAIGVPEGLIHPIAFANTLLRLLKVEPKDEVAAVCTDDELARLVADSSQAGLLDSADGERLRDALELGTRPVGEVLVPLARMSTVDHRVTPAQLEKAATGAGYSRMPVVGPGGTIMGYLHIKDAIGVPERHKPFPRTALHPVTPVQIDTPLDDALTAMRAGGTHLAAVTGDKGTVIGFVTMEDVLSELVGPTAV
jgi:CBS domain containing-hemolysin-like protein